jgi:hypothetical protein
MMTALQQQILKLENKKQVAPIISGDHGHTPTEIERTPAANLEAITPLSDPFTLPGDQPMLPVAIADLLNASTRQRLNAYQLPPFVARLGYLVFQYPS